MRKILLPAVLMVVLGLCLPAQAQFAKVGTVGMKFLDIGVGARGLAMGEAYAAVATDASAIFWNPAGIANIKNGDFFAGYTNWPADINLYSAAFAKKTSIGHIGLMFTTLNTGNMNRTTFRDPDGNYSGTFSFEDWAGGVTYARYLTDRFAFGSNIKILHEKLADWNKTGWAVDIGTYYETGFKSLRIGLAIMNFGPDMKYKVDNVDGVPVAPPYNGHADGVDNNHDGLTDNNVATKPVPLPLTFRAGVAFEVLQTANSKATVSAEVMHPSDNNEHYNFGGEYWFQDLVALRAGWKVNADEGGFTAGLGVKVPFLSGTYFDYAYTNLGLLQGVHRGSFDVSF
jgi:long-subunit fatty acid transport protein